MSRTAKPDMNVAMLCAGCGYILNGCIAAERCSECGRGFNVANRRSWTTGTRLRKQACLKRLVLLAIVTAGSYVMYFIASCVVCHEHNQCCTNCGAGSRLRIWSIFGQTIWRGPSSRTDNSLSEFLRSRVSCESHKWKSFSCWQLDHSGVRIRSVPVLDALATQFADGVLGPTLAQYLAAERFVPDLAQLIQRDVLRSTSDYDARENLIVIRAGFLRPQDETNEQSDVRNESLRRWRAHVDPLKRDRKIPAQHP